MAHEAAIGVDRWSAQPASARSTEARAGLGPPASAEVPTWQVEQCVLDLRWHTMSWWANGIAASATKYAARTHRRVTPSRGRDGATTRLYRRPAVGRLPPPVYSIRCFRSAMSS